MDIENYEQVDEFEAEVVSCYHCKEYDGGWQGRGGGVIGALGRRRGGRVGVERGAGECDVVMEEVGVYGGYSGAEKALDDLSEGVAEKVGSHGLALIEGVGLGMGLEGGADLEDGGTRDGVVG